MVGISTQSASAQVVLEAPPAANVPATVIAPPAPLPQSVIQRSTAATDPAVASRCEQSLKDATASFKQADFDSSLKSINQALTQCVDDPALHELRALVFFAKGDYETASMSLHIVMASSRKPWTWAYMGRLYPDVPTYTKQLRTLETFAKRHPDDAGARFVLAYHYMVDGYPEAAAHELELVIRLDGNDRTALELLKSLPRPTAPVVTKRP